MTSRAPRKIKLTLGRATLVKLDELVAAMDSPTRSTVVTQLVDHAHRARFRPDIDRPGEIARRWRELASAVGETVDETVNAVQDSPAVQAEVVRAGMRAVTNVMRRSK